MLKEQLHNDLKDALKSGDQFLSGLLRLLLSAIHNKEIEKRSVLIASAKPSYGTGAPVTAEDEVLTDEETLAVLRSEAKKRRESIEIFTEGKRDDLAEKEKRELEAIKKYLPRELSREEIQESVQAIFARLKPKDFGSAMKAVMGELKGRADSKLISDLVKKQFPG